LLVLPPLAGLGAAQSFSPNSDFAAMTTGDLDSLQIKITPMPWVANIRRRVGPCSFTASRRESSRPIANVGTIREVVCGYADAEGIADRLARR
jgi:hypothetical protein